jgi:hypothetical protein
LPYGTPTPDVIAEYLKDSVHTRYQENLVDILVEGAALSKIEEDILGFYRESGDPSISSKKLRTFLLKLGHQTANITKALFHSPFLYVDRNEGRRNYRFIILETFSFLNSCNKTKERLEKMEGTDLPASVRLRREQNILREWLFQDKETEQCSICGKLYSVSSLVCAHKKKRASCTEEERIDPHIVMPICLFGCDIMYENEYRL